MKIELYDIVELLQDLNPNILREMQGTVIAKYNNMLEVEFVDANGYTIGYMDQLTFKVTEGQIRRVSSGPLEPRKRRDM